MIHAEKGKVVMLKILSCICMLQSALCLTKAYVGIDLGTTFSCVAVYYPDTKSYDYLTFGSPDKKTIPSTIYFTGEVDSQSQTPLYKVGYAANKLNELLPDPHRYLGGFKRIVGIDKIEQKSRLAGFANEVTYPIRHKTEAGKGYYVVPVTIAGKEYEFTPTQLSSMVLGEIKSRLDELNIDITSTCISTPVYFTTVQDEEVKAAGINAGFADPIITKEPIAACVSYVDEHLFTIDVEEKIMVFDFGGGTLDISVVEVIKEKSDDEPGKYESNIVANRFVGDNFLGGENVNTYICKEFIKIAEGQGHKIETREDELRLRLFVEALKIRLCDEQRNSKTEVTVSEKFWFRDQTSITFTLSHSRFNQLLEPIYKRISHLLFDEIEGLFKEKNDSLTSQIKKVILVGGSTRIPYIRDLLRSACKNASIFDEIDADKAVGMGACKICVNSDPNSGDSSIMVLGAVPLPIGIKLADGSFEHLIAQNISIPTEATKTFTTVYDNQTNILIDVAMGVRPMFDDNEKIGKLLLTLKNPKPKGVPQILVKIEYFADYSFKITAEDSDTKLSESAVFKSELGKPSKDKIDQILETAKKFKAQDEETAKRLEQFRNFEAALSQFETQLNLAKSNAQISLSDLDKSYFETILDGSKKWLDENKGNAAITAAVIQAQIENVQNASTELVNKIQASQKAPQPEEAEKGRETL
ncbi:uncharacterized protein VICG_00732 [Vittaforma corneae ATCC 50505]|uniref:Chaperone DnaK n=1 Tax=Vittaforma corneae (strain ATCC 50505) TaxID=993615 RepID=L2GPT3_VITCO|nr:uncharacterized protein VICG_00732 [Vittaforma corneae ATCC 50505]ELA42332.1 hypothetical protein VICG_00732 [Vittaforma corneae ATCC 50505]